MTDRRFWRLIVCLCVGLPITGLLLTWGPVFLAVYSQFPRRPLLVAEDFLFPLMGGHLDRAYAFTTERFRENHPQDNLYNEIPMLASSKSLLAVSEVVGADRATVKSRANVSGTPVFFTLLFVMEDGVWKVDDITVP